MFKFFFNFKDHVAKEQDMRTITQQQSHISNASHASNVSHGSNA